MNQRSLEMEHRYGNNVHILSDPTLLTFLARLCSPETVQPLINELLEKIYRSLIEKVVNAEFPITQADSPTRMIEFHPEGRYRGPIIAPATKAVCVNLARAGTLPSHFCYSTLNYLLDPNLVRQDHISIARKVDEKRNATAGSQVFGHKIGGRVDDSIVLLPDPMGATGGTIIEILNHYKKLGQAKKYISIHCIITPEFIRNLNKFHPDLIIYAVRLDRGLSAPEILSSVPGTYPEKEKGLNQHDYIVPGGGGIGEVLNNAFV